MGKTEVELLEEILRWQKFMGRQEARGVVSDALSFDKEDRQEAARITYQLTNGENTTKDIEQYIPFSYKWVSNRHQEWAKLGIVEKDGRSAPYKHILSLDELGIDYPEIPEADNA